MNVLQLSRYLPAQLREGRYLRETWTSCSDIGREITGEVLTRETYLEVEQHYLGAVMELAERANAHVLCAHSVERWLLDDTATEALGLGDVFDGSPAPVEGELLVGPRLTLALKKCLREVAWLEFVEAPNFLVHVGHDLRVLVATHLDLATANEVARCHGLHVRRSRARLATVDAWR